MRLFLLDGWLLIAGAAVCAAAYEVVLLASRDNPPGRWLRRLMVGPPAGRPLLPGLKLSSVALVCGLVAVVLAPLVTLAELVVLKRRYHQGQTIGPAPWPKAHYPPDAPPGAS